MLATRNFGDWHTVVGEVPWVILQRIQIRDWVIPARAALLSNRCGLHSSAVIPSVSLIIHSPVAAGHCAALHRGTIPLSDIFPLYNYLND